MNSAKLLRALLSPQVIARHLIRTLSLGSVEFRLAMEALERGEYAFGIKQAIYLASKLKHPRVSVLEFGVGAGAGLRTMEHFATELGKKYGVAVEVYGFDLGTGLPAPSDYRDIPYLWKAGDYRMDANRLRSELKTAKLMLGDVRETVPRFLASKSAPVGFISFDLDYYSSTMSAFELFEGGDEIFLPRVLCYFDDVSSDGRALLCDSVGELLAIQEFNGRAGERDKICPFTIRDPIVKYSAPWNHKVWVYHRFTHREYNTYLDV
jgi:hypothetical protein